MQKSVKVASKTLDVDLEYSIKQTFLSVELRLASCFFHTSFVNQKWREYVTGSLTLTQLASALWSLEKALLNPLKRIIWGEIIRGRPAVQPTVPQLRQRASHEGTFVAVLFP